MPYTGLWGDHLRNGSPTVTSLASAVCCPPLQCCSQQPRPGSRPVGLCAGRRGHPPGEQVAVFCDAAAVDLLRRDIPSGDTWVLEPLLALPLSRWGAHAAAKWVGLPPRPGSGSVTGSGADVAVLVGLVGVLQGASGSLSGIKPFVVVSVNISPSLPRCPAVRETRGPSAPPPPLRPRPRPCGSPPCLPVAP